MENKFMSKDIRITPAFPKRKPIISRIYHDSCLNKPSCPILKYLSDSNSGCIKINNPFKFNYI